MSGLTYTRKLVKRAQHLMNLGEYHRALPLLILAHSSTRDFGEPTESAELLPRINHRLAQAYAHTGDRRAARARFVHAEQLFDRDNVIGRSITLRDHGWVEWRWGKCSEGVRLIKRAQRLLRRDAPTNERHHEELIVTDGILARTYAGIDQPRAIDQFKLVDETVRGGNKWIYELDNLRHLAPIVPMPQRLTYHLRSDRIVLRMIVDDELSLAVDDMLDGRFLRAASGITMRNVKRLLPF